MITSHPPTHRHVPRAPLLILNRDTAFLTGLKAAVSPPSPTDPLRPAVLFYLGIQALPRLASALPSLPLTAVLPPFTSVEEERRVREEAQDGILDMLKLFLQVGPPPSLSPSLPFPSPPSACRPPSVPPHHPHVRTTTK